MAPGVGSDRFGNTDLWYTRAARECVTLDPATREEGAMMPLTTILIIVLILMLIGALPTWPHSRNWGYYPGGGLGLILLIVIILLLMGRL
jgi:Protein of unknown function (DUF3309)